MADHTPPVPDEIDDGLAFAYGEDTSPPPSPSVIARIGEIRWTLLEGAKGVQLAEKGIESWNKRSWVELEDLEA